MQCKFHERPDDDILFSYNYYLRLENARVVRFRKRKYFIVRIEKSHMETEEKFVFSSFLEEMTWISQWSIKCYSMYQASRILLISDIFKS